MGHPHFLILGVVTLHTQSLALALQNPVAKRADAGGKEAVEIWRRFLLSLEGRSQKSIGAIQVIGGLGEVRFNPI